MEYEAILKGLQLLHEVKAEAIEVFGDLQLIINQLIGLYECKEDTLRRYYEPKVAQGISSCLISTHSEGAESGS